jgi:hypothetical protein
MTASKKSRSRIALVIALVSAGATFEGCATNSFSPTPAPVVPVAQNPQLELAVRVCDTETPNCAGETNFSLSSLRDLQVSLDWKNIPGGTHTQEIALLLPNGVVYQTVSHGFGVDVGSLGSPTVSDSIPVAGTLITQREMTGQWTVQVSLDGAVLGRQIIQFQP